MAMLAVLMPVMIAVAAFAINVAHMEMARTELQISMDVATRAAGRVLAVTGDQQQAVQIAEQLLNANPYANQTLALSEAEITFGVSTRLSEVERYDFGMGNNPNAVKIESNGTNHVPTLFPSMGVPIQIRPIKTSIATKVELDIALVIDRSGSMAYSTSEEADGSGPDAADDDWEWGDPVPPNSRWLDTVAAVDTFLQVMEQSHHDERVTLTTYASKAHVDLDLTNDYNAVRHVLDGYSAAFGGGGTNTGEGITKGSAAVQKKNHARPWAAKVLIVMSDGLSTTGTEPVSAAQMAAEDQVMVYSVSFSDEADTVTMGEIAEAGSGKHYHATDGTQLIQVFEDIARGLPTLITF
ncbi:von Willebrand factor type A domain protein [Stieleria maiorica]|uniref:von Willebrand factor type A domain protein n=1 Tax=Stieleria maiorica TaxID=2795974 RepID=A0A5B9MJU3_9BACT|nr:VWA domain-containing protein [Stieleria maiorica]QEG00297.1 von Willebrand factor type A domain protein [Stieleria maiorica]